MAYHLIGRDALVLVARVGQAGVGEVKRCVDLSGGHGRIHRVDFHPETAVVALPEHTSVHRIALLLDVAEVFGLQALVAQAVGKGVEYYVIIACPEIGIGDADHCLRQIAERVHALSGFQTAGYLYD